MELKASARRVRSVTMTEYTRQRTSTIARSAATINNTRVIVELHDAPCPCGVVHPPRRRRCVPWGRVGGAWRWTRPLWERRWWRCRRPMMIMLLLLLWRSVVTPPCRWWRHDGGIVRGVGRERGSAADWRRPLRRRRRETVLGRREDKDRQRMLRAVGISDFQSSCRRQTGRVQCGSIASDRSVATTTAVSSFLIFFV